MTQLSNSAPTPLCRFWMKSLLHSMTWLGAFSLLSNNLVLAQTSPDAVVVPIVEQSKPLTVKVKVNSAPSSPKVELRQKLSQPRQQTRQSSTPVAPRPLIIRDIPKVKVDTPKVRSLAAPSTSLPISVQVKPNSLKKTVTNSAPNYNSTYIDPTKYNIGATKSYEPPSSVVFSERSTGCQTVLRQGQNLSGSVCATARGQRTQVARSINTSRLSRFPGQRRGVNVSRIAPIRVGAISVSSNGFRPNRQTALPQMGGVIPRGVVSYNRTLRPIGVGNANSQLMFPLTIPASITSLFGWRIHPITGTRRFHAGTDLGAPLGTPVLAAYEGNVAIADFLGGYGLTIVLDHNKFTQQTLYAHLSEVFVQPGEWVEQGTVIGRVGSTGNSTGPHLHFEARHLTPEGWVATDPGVKLESAFAQLVEALRANHVSQKPEKS